MATAQALVDQVLNKVYAGTSPAKNRLSAGYTANGNTLSFTYDLGQIREGSTIAVGLEKFYVWSIDPINHAATVSGGQGGSTPANHASGDIVWVSPEADPFDALSAINDELDDISANGLYRIRTVDLTYSASKAMYDMTGVTNVEQILAVEWKSSGLTGDWTRIPGNKVDLKRNQYTSDFASGFALDIHGYGQPGQLVRAIYADRFTRFTTLAQDSLTDAGLPTTANDIPVLGAAFRLTAPREIPRNFTSSQGSTRRADEVPAGAVARSPIALWNLREQRLGAEVARQHRDWPTVIV